MENFHKKPLRHNPAVTEYLDAGAAYAAALQAAIEQPNVENNRLVQDMARRVMLKAAGLLPQDVLAKLATIQRDRAMKP